jgi:MFS family permease
MSVALVWLGFAATADLTSLAIGRAFLGFVEAPIEAIVPSTITDIFFLHERGACMGYYGLSLLGNASEDLLIVRGKRGGTISLLYNNPIP